MPKPIIYAATADRIGRFHAPDRIVRFYTRIAEAERLAELIATEPIGVQPYVKNVIKIAHAWMDICQFGKWFLEEKPVESNLGSQATERMIGDIDEALRKADETFPRPQ